MEARLNLLAEQLEREEGEAGDVNVYGVALLQSIVRPKLRTRVAWLAGALLLALLEVLSLQAIAFSTGYKMCVYDDECPLGTACVRDSSSSHAFFCADCREVQHVSTTGELGQPEWARLVARLIGTGRKGAMSTFTPARTNDRWPVAANSSEYCSNFLASEFVSAWRGGRYSDFEKCLHVQEALRRYGILDALVTMVALFLVCLSISADRKQQLMNRHLRETLLPPPWRSWRAFVLRVIEGCLDAQLPGVCFALILLITEADSMQASSTLLNGVAVVFILVIDDELPKVVLSAVDKDAVDQFAAAAGHFELLLIIKRQSLAHGSVSFAALLGMFMVCLHLPCDDLVMAAFGISTLLPFATRIAEEICGVQLRATRSALAVSEDEGRFSMAHPLRGSGIAGAVCWALLKGLFDGLLASLCVVGAARIASETYLVLLNPSDRI